MVRTFIVSENFFHFITTHLRFQSGFMKSIQHLITFQKSINYEDIKNKNKTNKKKCSSSLSLNTPSNFRTFFELQELKGPWKNIFNQNNKNMFYELFFLFLFLGYFLFTFLFFRHNQDGL